jgi:hypothetical protein
MFPVRFRRVRAKAAMAEATSFEHLFWKGDNNLKPPRLDSVSYLINGEIRSWAGPVDKVFSPIFKQGDPTPIEIGTCVVAAFANTCGVNASKLL